MAADYEVRADFEEWLRNVDDYGIGCDDIVDEGEDDYCHGGKYQRKV